ncbi:hypothetical protein SPMU_28650 [Sphingomonas mucosissima]|uniref:Uncharacterized protein n=1 Tax=Sphingomonas mucosissima TaxID=370959 RepID=A0A245ZFU5_9SPHN|nr:hypothetical protein SPMU_28650 [Sphingomonas mucosissima]
MSQSDLEYFYQRAEVELRRASKSKCPEAVKAHYELAGHYLDRFYSGEEDGRSVRPQGLH